MRQMPNPIAGEPGRDSASGGKATDSGSSRDTGEHLVSKYTQWPLGRETSNPTEAKRVLMTRGRRRSGLESTVVGRDWYWWLPGCLFLAATLALFGEFVFSDRMLYGEDILVQGYMARAFFAERLVTGDFPLWAPRLLGGVPTVESISAADGIYPTSVLYFIMDTYRAVGWRIVLHVLAGGFFMYGWARSLGLGRSAATVGGLAWLMAPVLVTYVLPGNDGRLMVVALSPLVFWAAESVLRSPGGRTAAGLAAAVAVTCLTCQFQTAYFLFGSVGAYATFRAVCFWRAEATGGPRKALLPAGVFLGSAVLGAGLAAVQLVPAGQYVTEYSRRIATTTDATPEERRAYASSWSFHPEEAVALVVPEFVGNSAADADWAQGTYWGRNAMKINHEYLGVTVLVLAIFGICGRRRRGLRWFMAVMSVTWFLFALGQHTPVWRIFYEIVPGMSLFRVPAICLFLVSFGVTTLFAMGVDDLVREGRAREPFHRTRRGQVVLGFAGLLLLGDAASGFGSTDGQSLDDDALQPMPGSANWRLWPTATPFITRGFGIAFAIAGLAVAGIWAVQPRQGSAYGWACGPCRAGCRRSRPRSTGRSFATWDFPRRGRPRTRTSVFFRPAATRARRSGSRICAAASRTSNWPCMASTSWSGITPTTWPGTGCSWGSRPASAGATTAAIRTC